MRRLLIAMTLTAAACGQGSKAWEAWRCAHPRPATVRFTGSIASTGPAIVKYQWVRSDHAQTPVKSLQFHPGGEHANISEAWTIRKPYSGWTTFRLVSPIQIESDKVAFQVPFRR